MDSQEHHEEEIEARKIKHIIYFCGKCNKIIGHDFFCKSCKIQYPIEENDDVELL
jgi:hypothetical protein